MGDKFIQLDFISWGFFFLGALTLVMWKLDHLQDTDNWKLVTWFSGVLPMLTLSSFLLPYIIKNSIKVFITMKVSMGLSKITALAFICSCYWFLLFLIGSSFSCPVLSFLSLLLFLLHVVGILLCPLNSISSCRVHWCSQTKLNRTSSWF